MNELVWCPFCGTYKVYVKKDLDLYRGVCLKCGATTRWCDTEQEATTAWNRRAGEGGMQTWLLELYRKLAKECREVVDESNAVARERPEQEFTEDVVWMEPAQIAEMSLCLEKVEKLESELKCHVDAPKGYRINPGEIPHV